jgi:hypothetical protein
MGHLLCPFRKSVLLGRRTHVAALSAPDANAMSKTRIEIRYSYVKQKELALTTKQNAHYVLVCVTV